MFFYWHKLQLKVKVIELFTLYAMFFTEQKS